MRGFHGARRSALLGAALVVAAGCGSLPNPLATPTPPDALHPDAPVQAVDPARPAAPPDPAKVGELAHRRATWDALRIDDYAMTVIYGCVCELAGRPIDVVVRDGRLTTARDGGADLAVDALTGFPATVDALFDYAERNANAGKIEFRWDPQSSIPTAVGVDPDLDARDDEIRIAILDFTPGP